MTQEKNKKTEELILFPDAKVADITIKPWSFGMLFEISGLLDRVIEKMDDKGIFIDFEKPVLPYTTIARIFTLASEETLEIICKTVDKPAEDIKVLSMDDGIKMAVIVARQNWETIKNAVAPLFINQAKETKEQTPQEQDQTK